MRAGQFIVRTWTKGDTDLQEDSFPTAELANQYAEASILHGYEAEVSERQPDLFEVAA